VNLRLSFHHRGTKDPEGHRVQSQGGSCVRPHIMPDQSVDFVRRGEPREYAPVISHATRTLFV